MPTISTLGMEQQHSWLEQGNEVILQNVDPLQKCVRMRFNDPRYCEVAVTAPSGIVLHCSRFVLRCSSDVLDRAIGPASTTFKIAYGDPVAVVQMLDYMHGGTCVLSQRLLPEVLLLAERYNVKGLIDDCKKHCAEKEKRLSKNLLADSSDRGESGNVSTADRENKGLDPISDLRKEDFLNCGFEFVERMLDALLPRLFLSSSFSSDYAKAVRLAIEWLQHDYETRQSYTGKVLGKFEYGHLDKNDLEDICKSSVVKTIPELLQKVLDDVSIELICSKSFTKTGVSRWRIPCSGNYFIVSRGGSGGNCTNCKETGLGGKGHVVAGTFYLESGSILIIQIAEQKSSNRGLIPGGGSSCVAIECRMQKKYSMRLKGKIHLLLVAAGGGAAGSGGWGMVNGEDAKNSKCLEGQNSVNQCGCPLRGMSVTPKQLENTILENANGKMAVPYCSQPGLAGLSYMSKDAKGTHCCCGEHHSQPSVSIYSRPSYI